MCSIHMYNVYCLHVSVCGIHMNDVYGLHMLVWCTSVCMLCNRACMWCLYAASVVWENYMVKEKG